jgi:hypothetical protein
VSGRNYVMKSLMIFTAHQTLNGCSNRDERDGMSIWYVWGTEEFNAGFWWRNLRAKVHLEDPGVYGSLILRWIFRNWDGRHGLD